MNPLFEMAREGREIPLPLDVSKAFIEAGMEVPTAIAIDRDGLHGSSSGAPPGCSLLLVARPQKMAIIVMEDATLAECQHKLLRQLEGTLGQLNEAAALAHTLGDNCDTTLSTLRESKLPESFNPECADHSPHVWINFQQQDESLEIVYVMTVCEAVISVGTYTMHPKKVLAEA